MNEKNDMAANMATHSPEVKSLEQPQTLGQETWPPENSNLRRLILLFYHLARHTNCCLKNNLVLV